MPVAAEPPTARRVREPGTPPRSLVALASVALVTGTGAALWLLPSGTGEHPFRPARPSPAGIAAPPSAVRPAAVKAPVRIRRPSGFVTFVDAARDPLPALPSEPPETGRRDRVHWFTLGHLTAAADGCSSEWHGRDERDDGPVAGRLGRLRAAGGDAGLVFGGPAGRELADSCADPGRLAEAYRRAVGTFGADYIDFDLRTPSDEAAVLRRADAIAALQHEAAAGGGALTVSFTLPAGGSGLARADQEMLRVTRRRGAEVSAVNLLVPLRSAPAGRSRLRPIVTAVRAAHPQIADSLGEATCRHRIALSPMLAGPGDLTPADARKLAAYAARNGMAWLSTRGASPSASVTRLLGDISR
ncbi:hypothetical protein [Streptosporangium sp. NPDC051022]|uniref:hypothetical protein n=1 Tax=Streptosporangium sp. NPDC051022 TaxID=3155752 RepID=UPI0034203D73